MTCLSNEAHAPQIVLPRLAQLRFCSLSATGFFTTPTLMKTLRVITPMAVRALTAAAAGLSLGCVGRADAPPQSPPASDYDVYAVILREQFINPPQDDHGDGLISECRDGPPVGQIQIAGETQFRRQGGGSRDSAAAAELPPDAAPLVATLRAMDGLPPRTLAADSFSVGMPVRLVAPAPRIPGHRYWTVARHALSRGVQRRQHLGAGARRSAVPGRIRRGGRTPARDRRSCRTPAAER
jgi:hypothetical protein